MTGRRGSRRKQLLDDLKDKRRYWKLKEEALDRTLWRTRFGRGYGPVVRQTTEWMNEWILSLKNSTHEHTFVSDTHYSMHTASVCKHRFSLGRLHIPRDTALQYTLQNTGRLISWTYLPSQTRQSSTAMGEWAARKDCVRLLTQRLDRTGVPPFRPLKHGDFSGNSYDIKSKLPLYFAL
jgi:hypothetical protein